MKDFDAERLERHKRREAEMGDRSFQLGGETFTYKANVSVDVLEKFTSDEILLGGDYIRMIKASCLEMIEDIDDAHERFLSLLSRSEDPITLIDLQDVFQGLVQEAFRRPTSASSPSGGLDADAGTTSTETSSTAPAEAAAA